MSIVQIARRAGVSEATVSRVLNDFPGVRKETKDQVHAAVRELNYVSPLVKRGPKLGSGKASVKPAGRSNSDLAALRVSGTHRVRASRRTGVVAVVAVGDQKDWLQLPVMAAAVSNIARVASRSGVSVILEEMRDCEKPCAPLVDGKVDGVIAFLSSDMSIGKFRGALELIQRHVPVVWAMGGDAGVNVVDHVIADDRAIAQLAFDCLVGHGCQHLAFVTKSPGYMMMRSRAQAFAGIAHDARIDWSVFMVSNDPRDGELFGLRGMVENSLSNLVDRIAAACPRPDGLFIGNDATTALVHPMLLQRGIVPGKDILLVSCDNEEARLGGLQPRPMSIDIGSDEVGAVAVERLQFRIAHPEDPPVLIRVAPSLPAV
jgi:LacI family transcriptional regulator